MKRREFITLIGGAAATWPLKARAQQAVRKLAVVMATAETDPESQIRTKALEQGLKQSGWTNGRNIKIEYLWTDADRERMRSAIADLVRRTPDLILATSTPVLAVAREQSRSIPIIFVNVTDPVGQGFVESLAHPNGNITGFTSFEFSMGGKWIEILKEVAPHVSRLAIVFNPVTAPYVQFYMRAFEAAAPRFNVTLSTIPIHNAVEIERGINDFARASNGGLFVAPDLTTSIHRDAIIAIAAKNRLPAAFAYRYFAVSGGLITYGVDLPDLYWRSASYVDRILKGGSPADLPVQQPIKFELAINLKTAKMLGLVIPPTLLARADEVIE